MTTAALTHKNNQNEKGANNRAPFFKPAIQPKLSINEPGDHYEKEADAMADHVMRMTDPTPIENPFFKPAARVVQRKCHECEEEDKKLHRKENSEGEVHADSELDSYVSTLSSSGQPMPDTSRQFFEPRFGHDFSNVKIHTGTVAAKSAQSINALAYTNGNNIVFNNGQYAPDSYNGKKLMAHELTHVVQQNNDTIAPKIQRDTPKPSQPATPPAAPAPGQPAPAPSAPASACPIACQVPILLLDDTTNCGAGDDFTNNDRPTGPIDFKKNLFIKVGYSGKTDAELLVKMKTGVDGIGTWGGAEGDKAADYFFAGSGKALDHDVSTPIGSAASKSKSFATTSAAAEAAFQKILAGIVNNPATNNCTTFNIPQGTLPWVNFPWPTLMLLGPAEEMMLKGIIGNTHGIVIKITALTVDCTARTYEATFSYKICDDFGVDEASDLYADSLAAFWVLQHMRTGHRPYVNNILLDKPVKSSF